MSHLRDVILEYISDFYRILLKAHRDLLKYRYNNIIITREQSKKELTATVTIIYYENKRVTPIKHRD